MPSVSKKQQRFFGMVHKCQKTGDCASPEVRKVANSISYEDANKFASTKHKGLPEKVEEDVATFTYSANDELIRRHGLRGTNTMSEGEFRQHYERANGLSQY